MVDVMRLWFGEQGRCWLKLSFALLPERHVALAVVCAPSAVGILLRLPARPLPSSASPSRPSERAPQLLRQSKPRDGENLVDAFQDRAGNARPVAFEPLGEVAEQLFGLVGIVEFPGLSQHAADRGMQRLGQSLHDVTGLVDLTTLDRRGAPEGAADRLRQGPWRRR